MIDITFQYGSDNTLILTLRYYNYYTRQMKVGVETNLRCIDQYQPTQTAYHLFSERVCYVPSNCYCVFTRHISFIIEIIQFKYISKNSERSREAREYSRMHCPHYEAVH